ncbi:hypothetical protein NIES4071_108090 (plasmid) [Calothrix sp. NIES-4071]|nr:hypothetical protein NIES4071_108090 [Calothrix sp. NIES-4071]BAZ64849.1 hypothetical protein NIES4105_105820 [Calothrix sp. NIES-4105]
MNQATLDVLIEVTDLKELSYDELQEREHLEKLVERAFYEAGKGLRTLRDKKLYRSTHNSFEEYCKERFGFERRQPYRLIEAAGVIDNIVEMCPNWTHSENEEDSTRPNWTQIVPTNECQVRPLTKLEPSEQQECWRQAVEKAGGKVPSGRQVKDIVDRVRERTKVPNPYREGEICILIPKDNPELRGKSGCWGIVTRVGDYSCTIETWESEYTVKIEHLLSLELSDDNCKFMRELLGRMRRLHQLPDCDGAVNSLLTYFGKQSQPYLTPIQEELLATIEKNYGVGEPKQ